jgi:Trk-type K+ transport system membrane component
MTLTSFFAMFFMRNTSLYNQLAMRDMTSSESLNSLLTTLLYILGFTLTFESIGMLAIWLDIHGSLGMTIKQELGFSAFHSISAFCNAGFSTMPGSLGNKIIMSGHNFFFITLSFLVIFGGLGFPVLINIKGWLTNRFQRIVQRRYLRHRMMNINTRIVIITTISLLVFGTAAMALLEWNHAFTGLPVADKLTQAFFNATVPRTAGFTSINLVNFSIQALLIYAFLMWIGGASQSTAGGIKVNVFAVAIINMYAVLRRTERVEIFGREISRDTVRQSDATVVLSILTIGIFVFLLSMTDGNIPIFNLFFECISAMGTVGSSLNVTPRLSDEGKLLISLLMFIGRVGFITLLMGVIKQKKYTKYRYPSDNIFIN